MLGARKTELIVAGLCLLAVTLTGCPSTEPSRFYLLSPLSKTGDAAPSSASASLGNIPIRIHVSIAEYLNRSEIVTRVSENQYSLAEYDLWAEPLKDNLPCVLVDNLSRLLGTDQVAVADWTREGVGGYHVAVHLARLDTVPGKTVTLDIRWQIIDPQSKRTLKMGKSVVTEPAGEPGFDAVVSAASRAVGAVSREIAGGIRDIAAGGKSGK
jgi:uncharacterized lipoprotein YmbA